MANLVRACRGRTVWHAQGRFQRWWTRGDSNPRPPHCEQWGKEAKPRRHNHLAVFTRPSIGKPGKPLVSLSSQCSATATRGAGGRNDDKVTNENHLNWTSRSFIR